MLDKKSPCLRTYLGERLWGGSGSAPLAVLGQPKKFHFWEVGFWCGWPKIEPNQHQQRQKAKTMLKVWESKTYCKTMEYHMRWRVSESYSGAQIDYKTIKERCRKSTLIRGRCLFDLAPNRAMLNETSTLNLLGDPGWFDCLMFILSKLRESVLGFFFWHQA